MNLILIVTIFDKFSFFCVVLKRLGSYRFIICLNNPLDDEFVQTRVSTLAHYYMF